MEHISALDWLAIAILASLPTALAFMKFKKSAKRRSRLDHPTSGKSRPGFTLVELMVVIAIVFVIVGLILGAVKGCFGGESSEERQKPKNSRLPDVDYEIPLKE